MGNNKGGQDARKAKGIPLPYTPEEEQFLKTAVRTMFLRAAEVEFDPAAAQEQITMDDIKGQKWELRSPHDRPVSRQNQPDF